MRGHRAANPHSRQPSPIPTFSSFPNHLPLHSTSMSRRRRPLSSPSSSRSSRGRPIFLSRSSSHGRGQQPPRHSSRSTPWYGAKFEQVCAPPRCKETPPRNPRPPETGVSISTHESQGRRRMHASSSSAIGMLRSVRAAALVLNLLPTRPHLVRKRSSIGHCYCCLIWSSTLASFCLERRPSGLCPSTLFLGQKEGFHDVWLIHCC